SRGPPRDRQTSRGPPRDRQTSRGPPRDRQTSRGPPHDSSTRVRLRDGKLRRRRYAGVVRYPLPSALGPLSLSEVPSRAVVSSGTRPKGSVERERTARATRAPMNDAERETLPAGPDAGSMS